MRECAPFALLFVVACSGASPVVVKVIEVLPDAASVSGSPDAGISSSPDATASSGTDADPSDPGAPPEAGNGDDVEKDAANPQETDDSTPPPADAGSNAPHDASAEGSAPVMCGNAMCPSTCIPVYQRSCCTTANVCGCMAVIGGNGTCT